MFWTLTTGQTDEMQILHSPAFSWIADSKILSQGVITPRSITLSKSKTPNAINTKSVLTVKYISRFLHVKMNTNIPINWSPFPQVLWTRMPGKENRMELYSYVQSVALKKRIASKICILSCFDWLKSVLFKPFVCFWLCFLFRMPAVSCFRYSWFGKPRSRLYYKPITISHRTKKKCHCWKIKGYCPYTINERSENAV